MPSSIKPAIRFEPNGHKYYLDDKEIPGLSRILQKVGLTKSYDGIDPWYAERGTAAHKAIELDLKNNLDEGSLDPVLAPFLAAWRKFVSEKGYRSLQCEEIYYSPTHAFACTIDHYGSLDEKDVLIDVKCTKSHDRGADFQLCGQAYALHDNGFELDRMMILELHEDGTFDPYFYKVDYKIMPAVMKLYRRKMRKPNV